MNVYSRNLRASKAPVASVQAPNHHTRKKFAPPHFIVLTGTNDTAAIFENKNIHLGLKIKYLKQELLYQNYAEFIQDLHRQKAINNNSHILIPCHGGIDDNGDHVTSFSGPSTKTVNLVRAIRTIPDDMGGGHCSASIYLGQCRSGNPRLIRELHEDPDIQQHGACYIMTGSKENWSSAVKNAIDVVFETIIYCGAEAAPMPDPQELFARMGARRAACMTMIGGRLTAPLTFHKPHHNNEFGQASLLRSIKAGLRAHTPPAADEPEKQPPAPRPDEPHCHAQRVVGARKDLKKFKKIASSPRGDMLRGPGSDEAKIKENNENLLIEARTIMLVQSNPETLNKHFGKEYLRKLISNLPDPNPDPRVGALTLLLPRRIRSNDKNRSKSTPWLHEQLRSVGFGKTQPLAFDIVTHAFREMTSPRNAMYLIYMLGIDANSIDANGKTVMMHAIETLSFEAVEALCTERLHALAVSNQQQSALSTALKRYRAASSANNNHAEAEAMKIRDLISHKTYEELARAFTNKRNSHAHEDLFLDHRRFRKWLTSMGVNREPFEVIADANRNTILHLVAKHGLVEHTRIILKQMSGDFRLKNAQGATALSIAQRKYKETSSRKYIEIMNLLLDDEDDIFLDESESVVSSETESLVSSGSEGLWFDRSEHNKGKI